MSLDPYEPGPLRYGDEYKLAAFGGVLQALVAYVESTGDHIRSIAAGLHQVLFLVRGSFYLVAITDAGEPEPIIERQLDHLHKMLLMLLTSAIERSFLRNPKFDIRPLLGGTDRLFSALIHSFSWDPASYLSSMRCLRIPAWVRTTVSGAIKTAAAASPALFALVFSGFEVVTVAHRKREPLHSDDIFLLLNFLNASDSFRTSPESFTPVCLPHYNPAAFLYAYVHYWAAEQPLPPTPRTIHSHSSLRSNAPHSNSSRSSSRSQASAGPGMGCDIIPMGQSENGADEDDDYSGAFDQSEGRGVFGGGGEREGEGGGEGAEGGEGEEEGEEGEEEEDEEEEDGAVLALEKLRSVLGGGMAVDIPSGAGTATHTDTHTDGSTGRSADSSASSAHVGPAGSAALRVPQRASAPVRPGGVPLSAERQTAAEDVSAWGLGVSAWGLGVSAGWLVSLLRAYQTMHSSMTAQTPVTAPHATGGATSAASSAMSASSSSATASSLLAAMETGGSCPVPGGIKTQYRRTKDFVLLSWRTPDFEIMAAFDPLATKKPAIAVCNAICHMLQQLESDLFLPGSVIF
ncbi:unnamed protein product [Closterium sp. Naga37s-1]|nr:unnamed protein product [Closterium sp. Naga37s-1]